MVIKEHCGVVGVWSRDGEAPMIAYRALKLLQHRGQESAGISYLDGEIRTVKGMGLVEEAIDPALLGRSGLAIGHVRYSTTGMGTIDEAQPLSNGAISVAFNGTIPNYYMYGTKTDTEFILKVLSKSGDVRLGLKRLVELADGAYSIVILTTRGELIGFRDPRGFRPLVLGRVGSSYVIASEDSAIRQLGGNDIRDVRPGEVVYIDKYGNVESEVLAQPQGVTTCSFEYIYFARADSVIDGISVYRARVRLGEILAERHYVDADIVVPIPGSSIPIAIGYSRRSRTPLEFALTRTEMARRSFIMPTQEGREIVLVEKFGVVGEAVRGKRVVLIDDSIVRGNTMKHVIRLLRNSGAREIHVRVGSPMIRYPCYMGMDFPRSQELIAHNRTNREIAAEVGADSVEYLTVEEMIEAIGRRDLCHACFTGIYPLKYPQYSLRLGSMLRGWRV